MLGHLRGDAYAETCLKLMCRSVSTSGRGESCGQRLLYVITMCFLEHGRLLVGCSVPSGVVVVEGAVKTAHWVVVQISNRLAEADHKVPVVTGRVPCL